VDYKKGEIVNKLEPNKYYLFSFQINNETNNKIEATARLEEGKIIFEFKIDEKLQEELMKQFKK